MPDGALNEISIVVDALPVAIKFVGGNNIVLYEIVAEDAEFSVKLLAIMRIVYNVPDANPVILYAVAGPLKVFVTMFTPLISAYTVYVVTVPGGGVNEISIVLSVFPVAIKFVGGVIAVLNEVVEDGVD